MNTTTNTDTSTTSRLVCLACIFATLLIVLSCVLIAATGRFNWQWGAVFVAAAFGSGAGLLGATLDHVNLRVKKDAMEKMSDAQKAYLAVRCSMALALGLGAAVVTEAALAAKAVSSAAVSAAGTSASKTPDTPLELLCVAAFAAAYLFDISKLSPAK